MTGKNNLVNHPDKFMCLFLFLFILGPRIGILVFWLFSPEYFRLTFGSFVLPLLGMIFLPWTTFMLIVSVISEIGLIGWFFVFLGFVADVVSYVGIHLSNRGGGD